MTMMGSPKAISYSEKCAKIRKPNRGHLSVAIAGRWLIASATILSLILDQLPVQGQLIGPAMTIFQRPPISSSARQAANIPPDYVSQIIPPYDRYIVNSTQELKSSSYVIDNKRYVEAVTTRCLASTILADPAKVEPSMIIITRTSEVRLNATAPAELIRMASFDPSKRTVILVHGFTQSYPDTVWLRRSRALFEMNSALGEANLIIMDWGKAAHESYSQAAAAVSGMGSFLANFIMKLVDNLGADRMSFHLICHSLGAHLCGFAGKRIRPRLGRITALDAAGPCFGKILSNSPQDRLGPDDAFEVDAYHYDDDFLGLPGQHGQFDVYVNGGSSQPGCSDNVNTMFQALVTMVFRRNRVLSESHTRSTEVPNAQLAQTGCQEIAYECRDWPAFLQGECGRCDDANNQCFFMGFEHQYDNMTDPLSRRQLRSRQQQLRTSFPGKRLFISTGSEDSFCQDHYQLLVKFEPSPELSLLAKRNRWRINLELISDQQKRVNVSLSNQVAPNIFSYLLLTENSRPLRYTAAQLQVRSSDGSLIVMNQQQQQQPINAPFNGSKLNKFRIFSVEINYMSNINPNVRRALSSRLCPTAEINAIADSTGGLPDNWLLFEECLGPGK